MVDTLRDLQEWAGSLPIFESVQPHVSLTAAGEGWTLYLLDWGRGRAGLKHYYEARSHSGTGVPGARPASALAAAESTGLRTFGPSGLAPELLWEGDLPEQFEGYGIVYDWVEGTIVEQTPLIERAMELFGDALLAIHGEQVDIKLLAPYPRNLESWWAHCHQSYWDLPFEMLDQLPPKVRDALGRLIQSVAGDVQAHKRFWQGAALTPVQGNPAVQNAIWTDSRVTLVDWHRFGLGDTAVEVAVACWSASEVMGEAAGDLLAARYMAGSGDETLARRVEIYRRLWPFGQTTELLSQLWAAARQIEPAATTAAGYPLGDPTRLARYLGTGLATYGWTPAAAEGIIEETRAWATGMLTSDQ